MRKGANYFSVLLILISSMAACQDRNNREESRMLTQEELIEANRRKVGAESALIDTFLVRKNWKMQASETGLRYDVFADSTGTMAKTGELATVAYRAYLLNGVEVENTASAPVTFLIGEDNVVSGLHEGICLMSPGDSARFVLPSHLAYGLTGSSKIPSNAALYYEIYLFGLR